MLRITMNTSASGAKKYYSETYSQEASAHNYYAEKEASAGRWGGKAAEHLGLTGAIKQSDFAALCDNINPQTGKTLTGRKNATRTVGYDFTFNANKSVSLAHAFGCLEDKHAIQTAFDEAVAETMREIERGMQARVRVNGKNENCITGNIAYGAFTHFTSRPVSGVADPHLHSHCFVFNASFHEEENKWKAGQFRQIKQDAPYYEAFFHSLFADKLQQRGFAIQNAKRGFELAGVDKSLIDRFSRRTKEIEKYAKAHGITDADAKSRIGSKTREAKGLSLTQAQQELAWREQLSPQELFMLQHLRSNVKPVTPKSEEAGKEALRYSLLHHFERKSVASDKEILATAIRSSIGKTIPDAVHRSLESDTNIISVEKDIRRLLTTKEALGEEKRLIASAILSKNRFKPINPNYEPNNPILTEQQRNAAKHALSSTDGIILITGKAGTGKTTTLQTVKDGIHAGGKKIFSFAPSSDASRVVLESEGFKGATTVTQLIQDTKRHPEFKNQVILVDEAGMLSNHDMNRIMAIAEQQNAQVILSGDPKQHSSVMRGDALRILQDEAGIRPVTIDKIQRQQQAQYREAVHEFSVGNTEKGFTKLEKMGAIHEIVDSGQRTQTIAADYYRSTYDDGPKKKNVLVVSPTHAEGEAVTSEIRRTLKEYGKLGEAEHGYTRLKNLQLTEAQKQRPEFYEPGQQVVFHQHSKGIKAGARLSIEEVSEQGVQTSDGSGFFRLLPLMEAKKFSVYEPRELGLAEGDKLRITQNGRSKDGKNLFNGTRFEVTGFDKQGNIKLSNGSTLDKEFGHFEHGYVSTSHSTQGKTADKVIISQSTASLRAASVEQFYVSISRAREGVSIYTDDRVQLKEAVSKSSARLSASELMREREDQDRQRLSQTHVKAPTHSPQPFHPNQSSYGFSRTPRTEQEHAR